MRGTTDIKKAEIIAQRKNLPRLCDKDILQEYTIFIYPKSRAQLSDNMKEQKISDRYIHIYIYNPKESHVPNVSGSKRGTARD